MITFENVTYSHGEKKILDNVSFVLGDGETLCVCGPSGAGKTSVMRLITSLDRPDSGTVKVTDTEISAVFQEDRLLPWKSVMENIMLFSSDREKALRLLDEAGLAGEEESGISTLSGGMKRRTALVRALCHPHTLLLLDEPFSGLDEASAAVCADMIKREASASTVVIFVHSPEQARRIAPSCAVLSVGTEF